MKKYIFIILLILVAASSAHAGAKDTVVPQAQEIYAVAKNWRGSVGSLRESVEELLKENQRLLSEKELLATELLELQESVDETRSENRALLKEPVHVKELITERDNKESSLENEIAALEKEIRVLEKKNAPFERRIERSKKRALPWEKKAVRLTEQKLKLQKQLTEAQNVDNKDTAAVRKDIQRIEAALELNKQTQKEIRTAIDGTLSEYTALLKDIKALTKGNRSLSHDLKGVTKEKKQVAAKYSVVTDTYDPIGLSDAIALTAQLQERNATLKKQIAEFAEKKDTISDDLDDTVQGYVEHITDAKAANQELSNKINDLTDAIVLLKRDNEIVSTLLDVQKEMKKEPATKPVKRRTPLIDDTVESIEAMAYAYASQGMYVQAIAEYQKALKKGGDKKNIYFNLGYLYYKTGDLKRALKYYKYVLRIDSQDREARENITQIREELSRSKQ